MSIQKEADGLAKVILEMHANTEMTLVIAPEFEGHEADIKQAVEAVLAKRKSPAVVELNGRLNLYASTIPDPT